MEQAIDQTSRARKQKARMFGGNPTRLQGVGSAIAFRFAQRSVCVYV